MSHSDADPPTSSASHDRRVLQARLQIIRDSLLATMVFNPLTTVLCALALGWPGSPFGVVAPDRLAAAFLLQTGCAVMALVIYRKLGTIAIARVRQAEITLVLAQALIGAAWGALIFLYWQPGNPVNHVFVVMLMAVVGYSMVFTRSMHMPALAAGLLTQGGLSVLRLESGDGTVAHILGIVTFAYTFYLLVMGVSSHRRVDAMIAARFTNEDLAAALRRAHDEALRKRYEAETANASKTAFLANMSHELRTPLNAILGFSDIIAHQSVGAGQMERYSDYAADIHTSGTHLLSLINDLLDVAKIEAGKMEIVQRIVDPRLLVESVGRLMGTRATEKGQTLSLEIAEDTPMVMADERAFKQMLFNLISNAVKFTPAGGRISVACHGPVGGGLEIAVCDNGPGIAPEKMSQVFEPFSQLDNRFDREAGGTGLGLALVRGLTQLHGGRVWLESTLGRGVTARIYLPSTISPEDARIRA